MSDLIVSNVSKGFGSGSAHRSVLSGVSCRVESGSFTALAGKSGSGKSTLLNCIAGLESIDSGEIRLGDSALQALSFEEFCAFRLRRIGIVFQSFNLLPTLNLVQNVSVPAQLLSLESAKEIKRRACALLEMVGLKGLEESMPHQVSGGELQRAAIARALINKPELLLADEPTGNLDQTTGAAVLDLFQSLHRSEGLTIFLVTHDRDVMQRADCVLLLEQGVVKKWPSGS